MGNFLPEKNKIDVNQNVENNLVENVFARMCQLLDENGNPDSENKKDICVPFADYDNYDDIVRNTFFEADKDMSFLSESTVDKVVMLMILEHYIKSKINTEVELDSFDDIINAIINPALCSNKKLDIAETELGSVRYTLTF